MCNELDYKTMVDFAIGEAKKILSEKEAWKISALQMVRLKCDLVEFLKENSLCGINEVDIFAYLEESEDMKLIFNDMMFHYYECHDVKQLFLQSAIKLESKLKSVRIEKIQKNISKLN